MFTGLVEGTGQVVSREGGADEIRLRVAAEFLGRPERGESIAVDGVCLTCVATGDGWFEAVVSKETLSRTTLGGRLVGQTVHLERPLRLGDRLGGHLVQGHVDGVGEVVWSRPEGSGARLRIAPPADLAPCIVPKGSVAVDGVSLTVAERGDSWFEVALIPETLRVTALGERQAGGLVNLEVDMMGRYVAQAVAHHLAAGPSPWPAPVTREFLAQHGFGDREIVP